MQSVDEVCVFYCTVILYCTGIKLLVFSLFSLRQHSLASAGVSSGLHDVMPSVVMAGMKEKIWYYGESFVSIEASKVSFSSD